MQFNQVMLALIMGAAASTTPTDIEARYTKRRLTQWGNGACGTGLDAAPHTYENKDKSLGCVSIDGASQSFDFALGDATHVIAFAKSNCASDSRIGVIYDVPDSAPNANGDCVNANTFMSLEPNYYQLPNGGTTRINSVKFE